MSSFGIARSDGRSNQQVVIDHVAEGDPGTIYTFEELSEELSKDTDRVYDRQAVCAIVNLANRRLLKEYQRRLHNVRGEGYRLAPANEHRMLATIDRRRADKQLEKGLATLRNVAWNELTEPERQAHTGQLMVMEALYANQQAIESRVDRIEAVIFNTLRERKAS